MNPFGRHLHNQLIAPLLLASIVVAAAAMIIAVTLIGQIIDSWIDQTAESATVNVVSRLEESSGDMQRSVKLAAEDQRLVAAVASGDIQTISGLLVLQNQSLDADNLMLLDEEGQVRSSTGRLQLAPGASPLGTGVRDWVLLSMSHHPILVGIGETYTLTALLTGSSAVRV
jgi:hypothetical protein